MTSRDEINLKRLLSKCELMAKTVKCESDWRFKSYVNTLEDMLKNLENKTSQGEVSANLREYKPRIEFLNGLLNVHRAETPLQKSVALQHTAKGNGFKESHEIYQVLSQKVGEEVREELFTPDNHVRQRKLLLGKKSDPEDDDDPNKLDALLTHHHNMQEKIAENMLSLAKNIKEQSLMAGKILKNDSDNVEKSLNLADKNIDNLKVHSDKLQESARSSWHCWTWLMLVIVFAIFINMVLLMRIMKKSKG